MRQSQSLAVGCVRVAGTATPSISGEFQTNVLVMDPIIRASQEGLVSDLRINGQPMMCSDLGVGVRLFDMTAQVEGRRAAGVPVKRRSTWSAALVLAAAGSVSAAWGVDPIPEEEAMEPDDPRVAMRYRYVFGLGSTPIAAGADAVITATCTKPGDLGPLIMYGRLAGALDEVTVTGIEVNGVPLLAGRAPGTAPPFGDEIPLGFFDFARTDLDGRTLLYSIGQNDKLVIRLHNYGAGAHTIDGGVFMLPS